MSNPTLCALSVAVNDATNAYYRALPGGRRGWKRPVNHKRIDRLHATLVSARAALHAARCAARAEVAP